MSNQGSSLASLVPFGIVCGLTATALVSSLRDEDESGQLATRQSTEPTHQVETASDHFVTTPRSGAAQSSPARPKNTILELDQQVSPLQVAVHATVPLSVSLLALFSGAAALRPGQGTNNKISFLGFLAGFAGTIIGGLNAFADFTHAGYATSTFAFGLPLGIGLAGLGLGFLGRKFHKEIIKNLGNE